MSRKSSGSERLGPSGERQSTDRCFGVEAFVEPPSHLCGAVVGLLDVVESVARDLVGHVVELYSRPAHLALDHSVQLIAVDLVCLDEELAGTRPNLVVDVGQRLDEVEVVVDRSVAVEELACADDVLPVLQKTVEVSRTLVSQHL